MTKEYYALSTERTRERVFGFLDKYMPQREQVTTEYFIPELSDNPKYEFCSDVELIEYLIENQNEPYGIYWNEKCSDSYNQVMAFFTCDGNVILGLALSGQDDLSTLTKLANEVDAQFACIGSEEPPPESSIEFVEMCKQVKSSIPDGAIVR